MQNLFTLKLVVRAVLVVVGVGVATMAAAQTESLVIKRDTTLRSGPAETAGAVAALPALTPISRLPLRQGPWVQVTSSAGQTGWVHMFDVTTASVQATVGSTAAGALRGLTSFLTQSSGRTNAPAASTATIGIRGLSAEDINNAQPNLQALAVVDSQRLDAQQARRFAADAPLQARVVPPLPVPASTNINTNQDGQGSLSPEGMK